MENFIHQENLALFKKRLAEQQTDEPISKYSTYGHWWCKPSTHPMHGGL